MNANKQNTNNEQIESIDTTALDSVAGGYHHGHGGCYRGGRGCWGPPPSYFYGRGGYGHGYRSPYWGGPRPVVVRYY